MEYLTQMSSSSSLSSESHHPLSPSHHHHYAHHLHRHRPAVSTSSHPSAISESSAAPSSSFLLSPESSSPTMHYLMQESLQQLANLSSATLHEMALTSGLSGSAEPMSLPQSLQHRQYQLPSPEGGDHNEATTTIMTMLLGLNESNPQQSSTPPKYDESVFSLLTLRNALIITCYSLIILVSLTGNLLVCRVAFGTREMRTTTNLLIASLACSDIVMTGE